MKNLLRRATAVILTLSFLMTSNGAFAEKNSDTSDNSLYELHVEIMQEFGIQLSEDVGASTEINRLNFVEMTAKFLNIKPGAEDASSRFSDVNSATEGGKLVNLFTSAGYIKGTSETEFGPDEAITVEQAYTILMRMMGYSDAILHMDSYRVARKLELNYGIEELYGNLTYNDYMQLLMNLFTVPAATVDRVIVTEDDITTVLKDEGSKTLPEIYRNISLTKKFVEANPYAYVSGVKLANDGCIKVNGKQYKVRSEADYRLLGEYVYLFYEDISGLDIDPIYAVFSDTVENKNHFEVTADNIGGYSDSTLKYYDNDKERSRKVSSTAPIIYNGVNLKTGEYSADLFTFENGSIRLLNFDSDGTYDAVIVESYKSLYVDYAFSDNEKIIARDKDFSENSLNIEDYDQDKFITVIKADNTLGTIKDIAAKQVLSYTKSLDGNVYEMLISTKQQYAQLKSKSKDEMTVQWFEAGTTYDVVEKTYKMTKAFQDNELSKMPFGDLVYIYIDAFGKVVHFSEGAAGGTFYGYIMDIGIISDAFSSEFKIKVFETDGTVKLYDVNDRVTIDKTAVNIKKTLNPESAVNDAFGGSFTPTLAYLEINTDGKIISIDTANDADEETSDEDDLREIDANGYETMMGLGVGRYCSQSNFYSRMFMVPTTIVMMIPTNYSADDDDYIITTYSTLKEARYYKVRGFVRDKDSLTAEVVLVEYGARLEEESDTIEYSGKTDVRVLPRGFANINDCTYGVVSSMSKVLTEDGEIKTSIGISAVGKPAITEYIVDEDFPVAGVEEEVLVRFFAIGTKLTFIEPLLNTEARTMYNTPQILAYTGSGNWMSYHKVSDYELYSNQNSVNVPSKGSEINMVYGSVYSSKDNVVSIVPDHELGLPGNEPGYLCYNLATRNATPYLYDEEEKKLVTLDVARINDYLRTGSACSKAFGVKVGNESRALIIFED